jgi:adenylate cyclase
VNELDPIRQLRAWQRFHLRITLLYAAAVFSVITLAAAAGYVLATQAFERALALQIESAAVAYAAAIDPASLRDAGPGADDPTRQRLIRWFSQAYDPKIHSVYILMYDEDPSQLRFFLDWTRDHTAATPGEVYDARPFADMQRGFHETSHDAEMTFDRWGLTFSAYTPIRGPQGEPFALVGIDVMAAEVYAVQRRVLWLTVAAWALAAVLIALASVVVGRNVRDPLNKVIDATTAIAGGAFDVRLDLTRDDEFGLMATHFDRMAAGLQEREVIRETFGRYVAPHVAKALLAQGATLGGQKVEVTVLFTDLRGYSTVSEALDPTQLVALSNTYLGRMQQAIDAEGGTVIEFLGDAILAVFGAPTVTADHAERAVRCALQMRVLLAELNEEAQRSGLAELWQQAGLDALRHRVGLHTGVVVAGNIGSATRMKYAVIGDAVNVAARLEQLNKALGTEILMSATTLERLPPGMVDAQARGKTPVKGRNEPVDVYAI